MKYYDFKFLLDIYSERKPREEGQEHDLGKIREKFTEIIDAVGIDSRLLKQYRDEQNGEIVKFGGGKPQFCFPETVCDFCVEIILQYTSADFKKIRSAEFASVNPAVSLFLMDGFTNYLRDLGHDIHTIVLERWKMDRRLHHHANVFKSELTRACGELADSAKKYEHFLGYEDSVYLIQHMVTQVNYLHDMIDSISSEYQSARYDEIGEVAMLGSRNMDQDAASVDFFQAIALADILEKDAEYQGLLRKRDKILVEPGFKQNLKGRYNKISSKISSIRNKHEIKLFGKSLSEELRPQFDLKHPMEILVDAIMSVDENERERIEREEKEATLTEEQIQQREEGIRILREFYEKRGVSFDLPDISDEEEKIFVNSLPDHEMKCVIKFPCCETEEIVVYKGSSGQCAVKCPSCGMVSIFNFKDMTAKTVSEVRRADHTVRD